MSVHKRRLNHEVGKTSLRRITSAKYTTASYNKEVMFHENLDASTGDEYDEAVVPAPSGAKRLGPFRRVNAEMCCTYVAEHHRIDEKVLVQVIHQLKPKDRERAVTGIRTVQRHRHLRHIHRLLWITQMQGTLYLVTEYPEDSLHTLLARQQRIPEDVACAFLVNIANTLAVLHADGLTHCNLSLRTILLCGGDIRVSGFENINQFSTDVTPALIESNLEYCSPEIVRFASAKGIDGQKSDVWALGCILHALVMGKLPFLSDTPQETIHAILHKNVLMKKNGISDECADLLLWMLSKHPEERPTMAQVCQHPACSKSLHERESPPRCINNYGYTTTMCLPRNSPDSWTDEIGTGGDTILQHTRKQHDSFNRRRSSDASNNSSAVGLSAPMAGGHWKIPHWLCESALENESTRQGSMQSNVSNPGCTPLSEATFHGEMVNASNHAHAMPSLSSQVTESDVDCEMTLLGFSDDDIAASWKDSEYSLRAAERYLVRSRLQREKEGSMATRNACTENDDCCVPQMSATSDATHVQRQHQTPTPLPGRCVVLPYDANTGRSVAQNNDAVVPSISSARHLHAHPAARRGSPSRRRSYDQRTTAGAFRVGVSTHDGRKHRQTGVSRGYTVAHGQRHTAPTSGCPRRHSLGSMTGGGDFNTRHFCTESHRRPFVSLI
eukprot:m.78898 g.78898  ORF g.78898 m.78898 type:complete len:669 (+) comp16251_c1_seq8:198-2204(+)